ncbi:hypothetical protein GCM10009655_21610 [Rhodoglobus aureus]|uniref:Uncharacterized protein n=1 Tax=Rhodoglobus aureus TaxID=191497 RepID=A0ABN1VUR1_9MICO
MVVSDQHSGGSAALECGNHRSPRLLAQPGIECTERLIEQHNLGPGRKGSCQSDSLLLAPRELVRIARDESRIQGGQFHDFDYAFCSTGAGKTETNVCGNRKMGKESAILSDVSDPASVGRHTASWRCEYAVAQRNFAAVRFDETCDKAKEGGFAASRGANYRGTRPLSNVKPNVSQNRRWAERFADTADV